MGAGERLACYLSWVFRSFRYKAKLSPSAIRKAEGQLALLCELWNGALQERKEHWQKSRIRVGFYSQSKQLPAIKHVRPEFAGIDSQATENVLRRLDLAFRAFFRRVKSGQSPGYPRFRSWSRYDSVTFRHSGWKLEGRRLTLRGIGTAKLFLSRPIEGRIKTVTLRRDQCGNWFVTFACQDVPAKPLATTGQAIGVDLGLASFLTTSDGEKVANPRHLASREAAVKRAQRIVSKRKRGGANRKKAVRLLAKRHRRVENARRDFHWKAARSLVGRYDLIAVEDLNVKGLAGGMLAKSVHDVGWGDFLRALAAKAEEAGRELIAVDPRFTSQDCSRCGHRAPKPMSQREHHCQECGLHIDRDENAARNILARAQAGPTASCPAGRAAA